MLTSNHLCRWASAVPAKHPSGACPRAQHSRSLLKLLSSPWGVLASLAQAEAGAGRGRAEAAGAMMQAEAGDRAEGDDLSPVPCPCKDWQICCELQITRQHQ